MSDDPKVYDWKAVQALSHIAAINARVQEGRRSVGTAGIFAGQLASFLRVGDQQDQASINELNDRLRTVIQLFGGIETLLTQMTNRELALPHQSVREETVQAAIQNGVRRPLNSEPPANS